MTETCCIHKQIKFHICAFGNKFVATLVNFLVFQVVQFLTLGGYLQF